MRPPSRATLLAALLAAAVATAAAAEETTICDLPRIPGQKEVVMLFWRGPTEVERGVLDHVRANGLSFNVTCLSADRDGSNIPAMVAEAKRLAPDLVYTWGTSVTRATVGEHQSVDPDVHVTDRPVLFTMVSYPVGSGIVPAFDAPRANVTGATHTVPLGAQIRAMQAYRPLKRLGVIYNPLENNSIVNIRKLREIAEQTGFDLIAEPVDLDAEGRPDPGSLPDLIARIAQREPQFLYIGPDSFIGAHRDTVIGGAIAHGLPAFTSTELEILRGRAMIGLVTGYYNLGRYMGFLIERVLFDRESPGDIPVSTLSRFTYALRFGVAEELGLYPPLEVLNYARIVDRETP